MRHLILLLCIFLSFPATSSAALLFSEIAWMGTDEDANNEWIEIYNFGSVPADVTGWTVTGGSLSITLSGTIAPHGVALLERTDDTSVPGVTALLVYTGSLPNGGATLTLRDPSGTVADEAVGGTDWGLIGGSNATPKKTAQRTRTGGWVTAAPTPGRENAQVSDTSSTEDTRDTDDSDEEEESNEGIPGVITSQRSGVNERISIVPSTKDLQLTLTVPEVVYVNQPVSFTVSGHGPGRDILNSLVYTWNFGDTFTAQGKAPTHVYQYPGEYLLVVHAKYARHDVTVQKNIRVVPVGVSISRTKDGDIVLTNTAPQEIDISGYVLKGTDALVLPQHTRLLKAGSITIDKERVLSNGVGIVALYNRDSMMLASEGRDTLMAAPSQFTVRTTESKVPIVSRASETKTPVASGDSSKTAETKGIVAGTSTTFSGLTIPVYAADSESTKNEGKKNVLPYVGLGLILVAASVLLYRRPQRDVL